MELDRNVGCWKGFASKLKVFMSSAESTVYPNTGCVKTGRCWFCANADPSVIVVDEFSEFAGEALSTNNGEVKEIAPDGLSSLS